MRKAEKWISDNTIDGKGICVTSKEKVIYPEVTGYYIPSLLEWGDEKRASAFANYLCSIQKEDGSWYDAYNQEPYVFDSAQIIKGLLAIRKILPEVDTHILKGINWILTNVQEDGRLTTPSKDAWGNNDDFCSELIHLYCLTPIRDAGKIFDRCDYVIASKKILEYYKKNEYDKIMNFSLLSHFYAYVMEGLFDMGEEEMCRIAMENTEKHYNRKGGIPGLNNVPWVCSTGLFQMALVWYKLGEKKKGDGLFDYACSFQNKSGGWYGSYPPSMNYYRFHKKAIQPYYFPNAEISWANKYFLDALALKNQLENK